MHVCPVSPPMWECQNREVRQKERQISDRMRMLWEQHVFWTRLVISGIVFDTPDLEASQARLLRNPKDFAEILRMFYGSPAAEEFERLFTEHLTIAAELVKDAREGNSMAATDAEKRWYENADQISVFLAELNPYWSRREWQEMLYSHLSMTKQEAVDFLSRDFAASVEVFDKIEEEALAMADMMTRGIVMQMLCY